MTGRCDTCCTETTELVIAAITLVEGQFHKTGRVQVWISEYTHARTHTLPVSSQPAAQRLTAHMNFTAKYLARRLEERLMDFRSKCLAAILKQKNVHCSIFQTYGNKW